MLLRCFLGAPLVPPISASVAANMGGKFLPTKPLCRSNDVKVIYDADVEDVCELSDDDTYNSDGISAAELSEFLSHELGSTYNESTASETADSGKLENDYGGLALLSMAYARGSTVQYGDSSVKPIAGTKLECDRMRQKPVCLRADQFEYNVLEDIT